MIAQNSSETVADQATSNTGASGGTAGSSTTTAASGSIPTATAVVAPKGFRQDLQQMLQGWQAVVPSGSTVTSSGGSLSQAAVLAKLQAYLGPYQDLDASATAAKRARAQAESQLAEARQYYASLKLAVANLLGPSSPELVQFGLQPRKSRKALTSSQLAVQAAKAQATRQLRGTIGAKKKAQIKAGAMKFVEPVAEATPSQASIGLATPQASTGTEVASTAPPDPAGGPVSPPTTK